MTTLMTTLTLVQFISVMTLVAVTMYKICSITSQVDNIEDYCLLLLIGQRTNSTSWAGESFNERFEIALEKIQDAAIENRMQQTEKDVA